MNKLNHVKLSWGSVESSTLVLAQPNAKKVPKMAQNDVLSLFTYLVERYGHFEDGLLANESSNECGALLP